MNKRYLIKLVLSILIATVLKCELRNKVYIASYIDESLNSDYDYHIIQFYQNSLQFDIIDEMNSFHSTPAFGPALFRKGDDNASYPDKSKFVGQVLQSDIPAFSVSGKGKANLGQFLPTFDMIHEKCYVAWDITHEPIQIAPGPPLAINKYVHKMNIKFFSCLNSLDIFFDRLKLSFPKIVSYCDLRGENDRFRYYYNNLEFKVKNIFPLLLPYYNCSPEQYLNVANPISDSTCILCPGNTRINYDQLTCVSLTSGKYLVLSYINGSKTEVGDNAGATGLSYKLRVYATDDESDAAIKYTISPEPKLFLDNENGVTLMHSNNYSSVPSDSTLYSYPFYPDFMTPIVGEASSGQCNDDYPYFYHSIYKNTDDNNYILDVKFGNKIKDINNCYPWFDSIDSTRDPSLTGFGKYEKNNSYNPSDPNDYEAELYGIWMYRPFTFGGSVPASPIESFMGPQNQFDDDYTKKSFPGDHYVKIEIYLDPAEFDNGDGINFTCANSKNAYATNSFVTALYGSEHFFNIFKTAGGLKIICNESYAYTIPVSEESNAVGTITTPGWYSFKYQFVDDAGNLKVRRTVTEVGGSLIATCTEKDRGAITQWGGTRNFRFTTIQKKGDAAGSRLYATVLYPLTPSISEKIKIKNFKRIFESEVDGSNYSAAEAKNNVCNALYNRGYYCRSAKSSDLANFPKRIEMRLPFYKDAAFEKLLPKFPTTSTVAYNDVYVKGNGY